MNLIDLIDYILDNTLITIYDTDKEENIKKEIDSEEARDFLEDNDYTLCSIEVIDNVLVLNVGE